MTKTEIIQHIASECDTTQKLVGAVLDSFTGLVGDELASGNEVQLMGFGKFKTSFVEEREGKNPQDPTGPKMTIPASNRIYFSAGKALKDKVNAPLRAKKVSKKAAKKKK